MSSAWIQYRINCQTHGYQYVILDENDDTPTQCPLNTGDTIVGDALEVGRRDPNLALIDEEPGHKTGGHFRIECAKVDITGPTGTIFEYDFMYPHDISTLNLQIIADEECKGEFFDVIVGPDTIVGALTVTAASGDTVITVSPTVVEHVDVGTYIQLFGGAAHEQSLVLEKDTVGGTLTLQTALTDTYAPGTFVRMYIYMAINFYVPGHQRLPLGTGKIGASYIPANTTTRLYYHKQDAADKTMYVVHEYLY